MSPYLCPKRTSYGKEKLATKEFKINKMLYFIKMLGFDLMSECLLITNGLLKRYEGVWTLCESHNFSFTLHFREEDYLYPWLPREDGL